MALAQVAVVAAAGISMAARVAAAVAAVAAAGITRAAHALRDCMPGAGKSGSGHGQGFA